MRVKKPISYLRKKKFLKTKNIPYLEYDNEGYLKYALILNNKKKHMKFLFGKENKIKEVIYYKQHKDDVVNIVHINKVCDEILMHVDIEIKTRKRQEESLEYFYIDEYNTTKTKE